MEEKSTINLPKRIRQKARLYGINISGVCRRAVESEVSKVEKEEISFRMSPDAPKDHKGQSCYVVVKSEKESENPAGKHDVPGATITEGVSHDQLQSNVSV